jgi:endothelin-converting enzyme/putative endopeptidase
MKNNPIPGDQARWGRFGELAERNREILQQILEKAGQADAKRSALEQKYGDYYASCMDEKTADHHGAGPLKAELNHIARLKSRRDLIDEVARLHAEGLGGRFLFGFGAGPDLHDASKVIAHVDQGGIGLPDRDYYLKEDPKSVKLREQYVEHVQKMFELLGDKPKSAAAEAKVVMRIETELAKASMDQVARRDPKNRDHKMSRPQLAKLAPSLELNRYFTDTGAPAFADLNVGNPNFFKGLNNVVKKASINDWKTYLRWHLVSAAAPSLSMPFVNENFRFHGQVLTGQKELPVRWKRCVLATDHDLGEALGQPYVDATFGVEGKQRTLKMVNVIEKEMEKDLHQLEWMTDATKGRALEKLHAITNKIGYPDKWKDYSTVHIVRNDFWGNVIRAKTFERRRRIIKIGHPFDKTEWQMTPPTVNAYYNPAENDINFPAGILQPPFYDNAMDDAVNYGAIGMVVGHELTHGFDDQGSKFDADGNLRNWWTPADAKEFEKRTSCLVDEYSSFVAVKDPPNDVHLNGKLTLGENTADNGGLRLAHMALRDSLEGQPVQRVDGFTPQQRLFLGFGQIWCENVTEQNLRLMAATDHHSPGRQRVIGAVQNMPEFAEAFGCKAGDPMVRLEPCRVW